MNEIEALGGAVAAQIIQTNSEYHSSGGISTSGLKVFMDDVREYWYQYISGEYIRRSKPQFDFGTGVHSLCFGGNDQPIVLIPDDVLASNGYRSGKAWKEFEAEHAGAILLKSDEYETMQRCRDAVMRHPVANRLLAQPGKCEHSFLSYDSNFELLTKCKPDKLLDSGVVIDLKTTSSGTKASKFVKNITSFGYHHQEAFYRRVLASHEIEVKAFVFIAVSSDPPFTVDCYTLSPEFLEMAKADVENSLFDLAERTRTGDWQPKTANSIQELQPPNYLKYKGEYEV